MVGFTGLPFLDPIETRYIIPITNLSGQTVETLRKHIELIPIKYVPIGISGLPVFLLCTNYVCNDIVSICHDVTIFYHEK